MNLILYYNRSYCSIFFRLSTLYPRCLGQRMFQILKYLHVNNGVKKMLGSRSKHKVHLYFIYTIYIKFKGNFRTIFLTHSYFNHEQTRKVRCEVFHVTTLCQGSAQELALLLHFRESRANPSLFTGSQVNGNTWSV